MASVQTHINHTPADDHQAIQTDTHTDRQTDRQTRNDHRNFGQGQRQRSWKWFGIFKAGPNAIRQLKQKYGIYLQNSVTNPNIAAITPFKVKQGHRFW